MESHLKTVGILHIIFGAIGLFGGLIFILAIGGAAVITGFAADHEGAMIALPILAIAGIVIGGFIFLTSIPGIIAGLGLLKQEAWAKILTIVLSILYIPFHIPFGTILGVYSLWVLFTPETDSLFAKPNPSPHQSS